MPDLPLGTQLAIVPLLIAANAFFVAGEYAVVAIREVQVEAMRRRGHRSAAGAMAALKADQASAIGAIQVCITMTNLLLGWIGEPAMSRVLQIPFGPLIERYPGLFTGVATILSFVVVTFLTVVLSELLPKALTLRYVPSVARLTAMPVYGILRAVRPLVWLMNATANLITVPLGLGRVEENEVELPTAEDIRLITTQAAAGGALGERERSLIVNSLTLDRRSAHEIMVPRTSVAYLDLAWPIEKNREVVEAHLYSRLPLCNGGMDKVVGIVPTREFLAAEANAPGQTHTPLLQLLARPATFAPENLPLDRLLMMFDQRHTQMILLVDEYGGVEGLVTLSDVVDELVGAPKAEGPPELS
ncbi:MAG: hemolysin family protein [Tepidisphaeraceae bacterium]